MDLITEQKRLQRSFYELLKERIALLQSSSAGKNVKEYAKAKGLVSYVQKLIEEIEAFKKEYFSPIDLKLVPKRFANFFGK